MAVFHSALPSGVRLLDCDHREMGELLQELGRSLAAGESMQRATHLLGLMRQITMTHFALEESMMQATDYPSLHLHRLEHQWLAEQNAFLEQRARRLGLLPDDQLLAFMRRSHLIHIHNHDFKYGEWLEHTPLCPQAGSRSSSDSGPHVA